jgi:hypothetical protein
MPDEFRIPPAVYPDENQVMEVILRIHEANRARPETASGEVRYTLQQGILRGLADIATNAWRARSKMLDGASGEVRDEMKRVFRHIEGILETFKEMGLEIKDHTGDPFDYGLPLKVVTTQPTQGIVKESVLETIKPTIYWQKQIIQMGEVVITTPA